MSDINIFPDDAVVIMIVMAMIAIFVAAMVVSLSIAWLNTRQNDKKIASARAFGYFIGASASAVAGLLLIMLVNYRKALAGWLMEWVALWLGVLVLIWPVAAYLWNRWKRQPVSS